MSSSFWVSLEEVPAMFRISILILVVAILCGVIPFSMKGNQGSSLPNPPELHAKNHELSLTLHAVIDANGRDAFAYNGRPVAPILRVSPGDAIRIDYINDLPEKCGNVHLFARKDKRIGLGSRCQRDLSRLSSQMFSAANRISTAANAHATAKIANPGRLNLACIPPPSRQLVEI